MRVNRYGSGYGGPGGGSGGDSRARAARFRRRYRVGQALRGELLRHDPSGLAWVAIDSVPLLARLESSPRIGQTLHFQVVSLYPEIVLRELSPDAAPDRGPVLPGLIRSFQAARLAFERAASGLPPFSPAPNRDRRGAFLDHVGVDAEASGSLAECLALVAAINAELARSGSARFHYPPWLVPGGQGVELLVKRAGGADASPADAPFLPAPASGPDIPPTERPPDAAFLEATLAATLPLLGPLLVQVLHLGERSSYRVLLEQAHSTPALKRLLAGPLADFLPPGAACLGVERMPKYQHGGVLPVLLSPRVHIPTGF